MSLQAESSATEYLTTAASTILAAEAAASTPPSPQPVKPITPTGELVLRIVQDGRPVVANTGVTIEVHRAGEYLEIEVFLGETVTVTSEDPIIRDHWRGILEEMVRAKP